MKKNKKIIIRTIIIAIVLIAVYGIANKSYASLLGIAGVVGLGVIFIYAAQLFMLAIGLIGQGIMNGLTDGGSVTGGSVLRNIFFNHTPLTTAAFFTENGNLGLPSEGVWKSGDVMFDISQKVGQYYYVLRNLAIAILLFVLLYIAIRMATSTLSEREARYKKMLTNWVVSLALVFVLHYIMVVTFYVNNTLVSVLERTMGSDPTLDTGWLALQGLVPVAGFGESLIFMILVGMEITFLFMYIKRILVLSFLILIAPLITITYSIDKIGDGKSQALNTWLKEFIYNVIIQPFHCILYITLIQTAVSSMAGEEKLGGFIIYILILQFVKEAENIIKKIFNIQADSMPGMKGMGALALGAASSLGSFAKGGKDAKQSNKMPKMKEESGSDKSKTKLKEEKGKKKEEKDAKGKGVKGKDEKGKETSNVKPGIVMHSSGGGKASTSGDSSDKPGIVMHSSSDSTSGENQETDLGFSTNDGAEAVSNSGASNTSTTPSKEDGKVKRFLKATIGTPGDFKRGAEGTHRFFAGSDATPGDLIKNAAKAGATLAGFGIGLGMGDMNQAIGLGMTGYGVSNKIDSAIDDYKSNVQLEENEDEYADRYADYVQQYRTLVDPNASEDAIRENLAGVMDSYDEGTLNYDKIQNEQERELKRKFITETYSKMKKSYKVKGDEDATASVKALTQSKGSEKFKDKYGNN